VVLILFLFVYFSFNWYIDEEGHIGWIHRKGRSYAVLSKPIANLFKKISIKYSS